ncbi:GNAT family N-acetyltransferase [Sinosporangium siamense]|uniref:GNAT family N-acetyltransferase n=1 Tax=Sinosporangium siamense TaxID=1367973 RepID=UPI0023B2520D|nr:GNAT family protein [Sinosporangium siamense]
MSALLFPDPPLTDAVVALRPWRRSDVPQRFAGFCDPLCLRFSWPLVEPFAERHVQRRFDEEEEARLCGEELNLAVADTVDSGLILGGASIYDVDLGQARAAIGYWLAPHARGRGVATRTLRLLARWAFDHIHLARLELTCAPDNVASQRVATRCGFVREGVLRSHVRFKGGRRDSVMFSLLPGELQ